MLSGTLTAAGQETGMVLAFPGDRVDFTLTHTGSDPWEVVVLASASPALATIVQTFATDVTAGSYTNTGPEPVAVRLRCRTLAAAESVAYTLRPVTGERLIAQLSAAGVGPVVTVTDDGLRGAAPPDYVWVSSVDDLPAPVAGVITLADNATYFVQGTVDLLGNRLVAGQNTTILGGSSENCRLKSTGLTGTALLSSAWSLPMRGLTIEADVALALDADGNANQALDWFGVNFTDCPTVGTIANYSNFIASDCAWLNAAGMTFDGSIGTIGFSQCIFDGRSASTIITLPATLTLTRRFRIIYSAFVVLSGETGINASTSATIPVEGYILDTVNFGGGGTYTAGVANTDNKALWIANRGVKNSAEIGFLTMSANATATTISDTGVAVKAAGTTTLQAVSQKFTSPESNRLTYGGAITRDFRILASATCTAAANNVIGLYIAKNDTPLSSSEQYITANSGGRAEGGNVQTVVELATGDYVEFFVENDTAATNITVTDLSVIAEAIN